MTDGTFAPTDYSLRLMESIAVGVARNESILLVGETGCGKTTVVQQLAKLSGHELLVQNLSLQTDSTDLLGGYRPLEMKQVARQVHLQFVDLFVSSFSRKQNKGFLDFSAAALKRGQWKKLSQCFQRGSQLGLEKVRVSGRKPSCRRRRSQMFCSSYQRVRRFGRDRTRATRAIPLIDSWADGSTSRRQHGGSSGKDWLVIQGSRFRFLKVLLSTPYGRANGKPETGNP